MCNFNGSVSSGRQLARVAIIKRPWVTTYKLKPGYLVPEAQFGSWQAGTHARFNANLQSEEGAVPPGASQSVGWENESQKREVGGR